jgi:hypothetical protein
MTTAALLFAMALGSVQAAAPAASTPAKSPAAANPDDLLEAVRKGDLAAVKAALDAGVPVDHPFRYERTALSFAAARGQVEIAQLLLERGADPNKKDSYYGAMPSFWAVNDGHVAVVRLLLDKGAPAGPELLSTGAREGNAELIALALEKTKPSADDLAMALADAQEGKHEAAVQQLTQAGARPPAPADFPVDAATLAGYAGAYHDERGGERRFELREGKLVCVNCNPPGMVLGAIDAVTFRTAVRPRPKFVFSVAEGKTTGFVLDFGDRQVPYKRAPDEAAKEKP